MMYSEFYENYIINLLLDNSCSIVTKSDYKTNNNTIVVIDNNKKEFTVSQDDFLDFVIYIRNLFKTHRFIKDKDV